MTSPSYLEALRTQIMRDTAVLASDPFYHVPSTAFFMRRLREFKAEYRRLTKC